MRHRISRHVRANVIAYVALFVACSGTAVASSQLAANSVGTKQLKNGAVTGRKVAKSTLTGANIKASTLGTVPSATHAANATSAVSATNAANAANAAQLGGQAPASFQARVSGTCASGSAIASIAAGGTVGCQLTNVTQMMGGIQTLSPNATSRYLAAEGLTTTASTNSTDNALGASARAGTAGNLDVGIFNSQPTPLTFTLDVNANPTAVSCTIPASGTTCSDSTDTASIPAGALLNLSATGGSGPATQVSFGWTDTTSG